MLDPKGKILGSIVLPLQRNAIIPLECLEASLSRLSRTSAGGYHFASAVDLGAVYCGMGPASQALHNVVKPGVFVSSCKR